MFKIARIVWLGIMTLCPLASMAQTSPVFTDPTADQVITQPGTSTLTVAGSGNFSASNFTLGTGYMTSNGTADLLLQAGSNGTLTADVSTNTATAQGGTGMLSVLLPGNASGDFMISDATATSTFFCADTTNDWVSVGESSPGVFGPSNPTHPLSPTNWQPTCVTVPFDIFDVSNRETLGNGYMHWFSNGANPSAWNAGISNPNPGILSFDATTTNDGQGAISVGNITLIAATAGGGGAITFPDTSVQATAWNGTTLGGDYAEAVDVSDSSDAYEPGDVLVIDTSHPGEFLKSTSSFSKLVAGVYSTKPGLVGKRQTGNKSSEDALPMAMMGIVPTKASAENGPIHVGDLLVSASTAGRVMRAGDAAITPGTIVGKALSDLNEATGVIEALITLQ